MKVGGIIMNNLIRIIEQFKNKKIIVLGDVMLDKYIWGEVSRISPEAPVQVVNVIKESHAPGGAANVANNIAALNAKSLMVGIVGNDKTKDELSNELKKRNIDVSGLISDENKRTIRKVRVFGRSQQLLRFDYEKKGYVDSKTENNIFDFISKKIDEIDAIIISDYAKGAITKSLMEKLIALCKEKNKIIIVDPKPEHKDFYKNATLISPNHKEAYEMIGLEEESDADTEKIGAQLLKELNSNVLVTKGEKGMSLFEKNGKITNIPTFAKEVYDIIGAGDTSVATLTLALASGASFEEAAIIANHAAGITVGKIGTSTISIEELKKSIENE
jgi:rfaE bifunctional protein kinase chain/domain